MRIEVLWTPGEVEHAELTASRVVVVDVLRATTSILVALEAGAERVLPVVTTEEAVRLADDLGRDDVLLCGEREGKRIEGFDLGNSPREYGAERVEGRTLVYSTTNGTRAVRRAAGADAVGLGCFRNLGAVAAWAAGSDHTAVLCAGRRGRVSLDDALCAGHLVRRLACLGPRVGGYGLAPDEGPRPPDGGELALDDGALGALRLAESVGDPDAGWMAGVAAGAALVDIGFGADLEACARTDVSDGVPILAGRGVVLEPTGG